MLRLRWKMNHLSQSSFIYAVTYVSYFINTTSTTTRKKEKKASNNKTFFQLKQHVINPPSFANYRTII